MTIIKDQEHYNPEEPKPEFIETKGFKHQVFKDHVRFLFDGKELRVPVHSLEMIMDNVKYNQKDGYYTGQCLDCHKFDALVKGYCKPCFDKEQLEYDTK
jgi:hypothetical protein